MKINQFELEVLLDSTFCTLKLADGGGVMGFRWGKDTREKVLNNIYQRMAAGEVEIEHIKDED